ncbi:MAG: flagellar hook-associated protein FlgK, partial [Thermincolia bacterium]
SQIRNEAKSTGFWEAKQDALRKLEVIVNEPSNAGLRSVMDQFWAGLQELSKNPESAAVRKVVRQRGISLAETFNHMNKQLKELAMDTDTNIRIKVDEINNISSQIAKLNDQIIQIENTGDKANDLRDKRDLLIDQFSKIVNISTVEEKNGGTTVTISGRVLVEGKNAYALQAVSVPPSGYADVRWAADNTSVIVKSGTMRGLLNVRDNTVPAYIGYVDTLANTLVTDINFLHAAGRIYNGAPPAGVGFNFFNPTGTTAGSIAVDSLIIANENNIAAATLNSTPGDGSNALAMAQRKHAPLIAGVTMDDFFRSIIGQLGVEAQEATRMVENQGILTAELENRRQALSGVSLDEEMTNMIRFQHGYNAAARLVTTMDEMIDTIINRLGLVGR